MSHLADKVKGAIHKIEDKIQTMKERRRSKSEEHAAPVTSTSSDPDEIRQEPLAPQVTHAAATGETSAVIKDEAVPSHDSQIHTMDTQTGQRMHDVGTGTQLHDPPVGFGSTTIERSLGNEPSTGAIDTTAGTNFAASTTQATPTDEGNGRI